MEGEKALAEAISILKDAVNRTDELNKRLIKTIQLIVVAFLICITICFGILYLSDYTTTNMQQQQMSSEGMQQQQK